MAIAGYSSGSRRTGASNVKRGRPRTKRVASLCRTFTNLYFPVYVAGVSAKASRLAAVCSSSGTVSMGRAVRRRTGCRFAGASKKGLCRAKTEGRRAASVRTPRIRLPTGRGILSASPYGFRAGDRRYARFTTACKVSISPAASACGRAIISDTSLEMRDDGRGKRTAAAVSPTPSVRPTSIPSITAFSGTCGSA